MAVLGTLWIWIAGVILSEGIGRPRQLYIGEPPRDYVDVENR